MKKLILILVICAPLMSVAGNVNPVKSNFTEWINNNICLSVTLPVERK